VAGKHAVETLRVPAVETSTSGHHALVLHPLDSWPAGLRLGQLAQDDLDLGLLDPLLAKHPSEGPTWLNPWSLMSWSPTPLDPIHALESAYPLRSHEVPPEEAPPQA
jgi:hypothetical protein